MGAATGVTTAVVVDDTDVMWWLDECVLLGGWGGFASATGNTPLNLVQHFDMPLIYS